MPVSTGATAAGVSGALAALGGAITGVIDADLPEVVTTQLVARCRTPPRIAVATSVFALATAPGV